MFKDPRGGGLVYGFDPDIGIDVCRKVGLCTGEFPSHLTVAEREPYSLQRWSI